MINAVRLFREKGRGLGIVSTSSEDVKGPKQAVIKRLFARSGNQCAFPKCSVEIVQGDTVVGKICHIKAASPNDPRQTASERHGYDNLLLLCANHHTIIDDDPEAYTVDRLVKMKRDQEQRAAALSSQEIDHAMRLLINRSMTPLNQSGGIAAYNINANTINVHSGGQALTTEQQTSASIRPAFPAAEPRDGIARFRHAGEPIGQRWSIREEDVVLSPGSAMFLRLMPMFDPIKRWPWQELQECASGIHLRPLFWVVGDYSFLRAEDGFGMYPMAGKTNSEVQSVAFAFETGEIWSVDTILLSGAADVLLSLEIERAYIDSLQNYTAMLQGLGVAPPYQWVSGLTDVKDRRLEIAHPNRINLFPGRSCLSNTITAQGISEPGQTPAEALRPFFELIFHKCGIRRPAYLNR
jgi:hypothetical protein